MRTKIDSPARAGRGVAARTPAGTSYEIADPRIRPTSKEAAVTEADPPSANQGSAVRQAIKGDRSRDIDRWQGFSRRDAAELAEEVPDAEQPAKPRAGLARDGGPAPETVPAQTD